MTKGKNLKLLELLKNTTNVAAAASCDSNCDKLGLRQLAIVAATTSTSDYFQKMFRADCPLSINKLGC